MKLLTLLLALTLLPALVFAQTRGHGPPIILWGDPPLRQSMMNAGWQFSSTLGIDERMCYALPPGKKATVTDWGDKAKRDAGVKAGWIRYKTRDDGRCYSADVPH